MLKPWKIIASWNTYKDRWLTVRSYDCITDTGRLVSPYHVLDYPDWVHVIAITPSFELVLVRQYRHGVRKILLELPCGCIEAADSTPLDAAGRELQEETGYVTDNMVAIADMIMGQPTEDNGSCCPFIEEMELSARVPVRAL